MLCIRSISLVLLLIARRYEDKSSIKIASPVIEIQYPIPGRGQFKLDCHDHHGIKSGRSNLKYSSASMEAVYI